MKKRRFSEEKMVAILQEVERSTVADVAKKYAVSEASIYNWRKHFNGMEPSDVRRQIFGVRDIWGQSKN
jgi:putative transposase